LLPLREEISREPDSGELLFRLGLVPRRLPLKSMYSLRPLIGEDWV
jgi:hypothetical protein